MAAIDKLYIKSYYELDDIRKWSIAYYPELLFYIPYPFITYDEFEERRKEYIKQFKEHAKRDFNRLSYGGSSDPVKNLRDYYKNVANYDCPVEQAVDEIDYCFKANKMSDDEIGDTFTLCALHAPMEIDCKLKWICPVPCIREYLHKQCGVNEKHEWFYSLFWKGKKHFNINLKNKVIK